MTGIKARLGQSLVVCVVTMNWKVKNKFRGFVAAHCSSYISKEDLNGLIFLVEMYSKLETRKINC